MHQALISCSLLLLLTLIIASTKESWAKIDSRPSVADLTDAKEFLAEFSPKERTEIESPDRSGIAGNPGLEIRLQPLGIDYTQQIAAGILREEFARLRLSNYQEGNLGLSAIQIANLRIPKYKLKLSDDKENGLIDWTMFDGSLGVNGEFGYRTHIHICPFKFCKIWITKKGQFRASSHNWMVKMKMRMTKDDKGRPKLIGEDCNADLRIFGIELWGDIVNDVINIFKAKIAEKYKPLIQTKVCAAALKFVNEDVNKKLDTFPVGFTLEDKYMLDYRLMDDPNISGEGLISRHRGRVLYQQQGDQEHTLGRDNRTLPALQLEPPTMARRGQNANNSNNNRTDAKMMQILASDYLLNTFLREAYALGSLNFTINETNQPSVMRYLRTTCAPQDKLCLGSLFQQTAARHPNKQAEVIIYAKQAPTITFLDDRAIFRVAEGHFDLFIVSPPSGPDDIRSETDSSNNDTVNTNTENNTTTRNKGSNVNGPSAFRKELISSDFLLEAEVDFRIQTKTNVTANATVSGAPTSFSETFFFHPRPTGRRDVLHSFTITADEKRYTHDRVGAWSDHFFALFNS